MHTHELGLSAQSNDSRLAPLETNLRALADFDIRWQDIELGELVKNALAGLPAQAEELVVLNEVIQAAAAKVSQDPAYSKLAAGLLSLSLHKELAEDDITCFSQSIQRGYELGLIGERVYERVLAQPEHYDKLCERNADRHFEFLGLRTLADRYLLKHPAKRTVLESPQMFFLRIACGLCETDRDVTDFYETLSKLEYLPSSPTLFNAGTNFEQLSSCFLLDSPADSLDGIYDTYKNVARLSKFSGGIGLAYHRVRARGSLIKSTNGFSSGIVPFLKTLDSSVAAVNQGGKRKGACCVYLEPWHADIEEFLELRNNTGDEGRRTHNLNLANWLPDLFMKRVEADEDWSLFDPKDVPELPDLYGEAFERAYIAAEKDGRACTKTNARELYGKMMRTLAETGNGWMTFKDASNRKCNQVNDKNRVHLSNLCTEILEVTDEKTTAVCNLGSINLRAHVIDGEFDFDRLARNVKLAIRQLDRVIDLNYYPIDQAANSNAKWRPVGLGLMGLQDVFFKLGIDYDSVEARDLSTKISAHIYFHAIEESSDLAGQKGSFNAFSESRTAEGQLQFDLWEEEGLKELDWQSLKDKIKKQGLRNSLLIAIAPTATISLIAGCYECIEPQASNLFKRETMSGEFIQINPYLVRDLKELDLWDQNMRDQIKASNGSVQEITRVPEPLRRRYRTAWELSMRDLIDMAAARGPYIDQSQSLNLFMSTPNIGAMSSMYFYAWQKGLKTTYYLRSKPATTINKATVAAPQDNEAVACSIENPEYCEACQ